MGSVQGVHIGSPRRADPRNKPFNKSLAFATWACHGSCSWNKEASGGYICVGLLQSFLGSNFILGSPMAFLYRGGDGADDGAKVA